MPIRFNQCLTRSVGVEWELQLLDAKTYDLTDQIIPLLEIVADPLHINPEFIQNTVEIVSSPCESIHELEAHVGEVFARLRSGCEQLGLHLCGAGTHPFSERLALLTPLPRYLALETSMGILSHTQITFGTHAHIGMRSGEEAIAVMNHLIPYIPMLVALSANSPFWRGYETGHASYRQRILAGARSYDLPPPFASWQEFERFIEGTIRTGIYAGINDIHWDIRPRPHFGTLEIRLMDSQTTLQENLDLTALIFIMVEFIANSIEEGRLDQLLPAPHPWIQKENRFQAAHQATSAHYVNPEMQTVQLLREQTLSTLRSLEPCSKRLDLSRHLQRLITRVEENQLGYQRQRACFHQSGSFPRLARQISEETIGSTGSTEVGSERHDPGHRMPG